ncbi:MULTISPECIES: hypothetical protein [Enterococcus]|nr:MULTISPECIES: hypothetical protein [Enterococcus]MCX4166761.1 hypothetical protein [Enterococcus casseliflavus]MDB1687639.1 hypothetical protein [Enterococcus casseliflavus]MDO0893955.1 hypothetical protein [Enterococcus sp. B1E4]MDO0906909.1 hypothetical protein [Enterococcus sp. B2E4]MDT2956609.1 hypothetical protein [Enterococcus casseliflavus]
MESMQEQGAIASPLALTLLIHSFEPTDRQPLTGGRSLSGSTDF